MIKVSFAGLSSLIRSHLIDQRQRSKGKLTPLPVLADPVPMEGIDLNDTSRLWEVE